jgi:hypothetical protein
LNDAPRVRLRRCLQSIRNAAPALLALVFLLACIGAAPAAGPAPADVPAAATKGSKDIPGGSLEANERGGGHMISRHVGKTAEELLQRLQKDPKISASSSFTDLKSAEAAVSTALATNRTRIRTWLAGRDERLVVTHRFDLPVGITLSRSAPRPRDAYRVRVVLVRERKFAEGWRILTAYPEL